MNKKYIKSTIEKFIIETSFMSSVNDISKNESYKIIDTFPKKVVEIIIQYWEKDEAFFLLPIVKKFYPDFVVQEEDKGKFDIIIKKCIEHIQGYKNKKLGYKCC